MNNNNSPAILKALIAYAICVPVAVFVGFLLASESAVSQPGGVNWAWNLLMLFKAHPFAWGALGLVLFSPLLLRWHHFLLVATWSLPITLYFLPGSPQLNILTVALSLGISVLHRAMNKKAHFIPAPQITWPLLFMMAVVLFTAKLRGGIGLHSMGSEEMGGKRYIFILISILGYFALTAQRIPPQRAGLYVTLFFLAGFTNVISDLAGVLPSSLYFIYALFPVSAGAFSEVVRYGGLSNMASYAIWLMLARYGVRGIFSDGRLWRILVFGVLFILLLPGGFRSDVIHCGLVFAIQFYLEGMHRTKLLPAFIFAGIFLAVLCVPFADKLPFTFQRSLAFLPLHISPAAREAAATSTDWRLEIWKSVLPQVPEYLLLGKGYGISQTDYENMTGGFNDATAGNWASTIAGDYHSGPLSVIIPFGIWGAIGFLWFLMAAGRALHSNYRYGDPALRTVNTLLFSFFLGYVIMFFVIFGSLYSDMGGFVVIVGLSISLNGGIRRASTVPQQQEIETKIPAPAPVRPRLQPFYQP